VATRKSGDAVAAGGSDHHGSWAEPSVGAAESSWDAVPAVDGTVGGPCLAPHCFCLIGDSGASGWKSAQILMG